MNLPLFQIDAFTDRTFGGNPAAVVPLENWLPDALMQQIALENNLSETVFLCPIPSGEAFGIRWFTPQVEVNLCGHATVAAAYYLFELNGHLEDTIIFHSKSGELTVRKSDDWYILDFPAMAIEPEAVPEAINEALQSTPTAAFRSADDWMFIYETEEQIRALSPKMSLLKTFPARGIIVTAPANETDTDFVSRFFAPAVGVDEDPVTGSAHTKLIPYWGERLNKATLNARQLSARGGILRCKWEGNRVLIGGQATLYLVGNIYV